jgi:hypothetical protein
MDENEVLIGVMELNEAKTHQLRLKAQGVELNFKTNGATCTTGCKVTVEVWGLVSDQTVLNQYFQSDYLKHLKGHVPNFEHLSQIFDSAAQEVICQACGMKFKPSASECPDCGLVYS